MDLNKLYPQHVVGKESKTTPTTTQKLSFRERVLHHLNQKSDVPAFRATTRTLNTLINQPDASLESIAEVVRLDAGLTAQLLRLASSPMHGGKNLTSLQEALLLIGMDELKKAVSMLTIMGGFSRFRVKINWDLFWMHSLLTARLTESLCQSFAELDGREYLAGLLHDVGKLFMEHHFPQEFELILTRAMMTHRGMYDAERSLFDIDHAEIASLLCDKWQLNAEISTAIQFHHNFECFPKERPADFKYPNYLFPLILCIADKLANICHANIEGAENLDNVDFHAMPQWKRFKEFRPRTTLNLDLTAELQRVQDTLTAIKGSAGPASPSEETGKVA
jgi:putative nucleotidyltransferase with HDIG domain